MKNKILASLLAVCLFAGLAVPAFASTTSSQQGDASKVTKIEFDKTAYDVKQDTTWNAEEHIRVYESNKKLILDLQQISYSLEGAGTAFQIDGHVVTAVENTGTATLVATDDQSGKIVGKTTLKAVTNPTKGYALSFKYANQTNIQIPVGPKAEDFTFKVSPISTGNQWTGANQASVSGEVIADINAAIDAFHGSSIMDGTNVSAVPGAKATYTATLTGMTAGTITSAFGYTVNVPFSVDVEGTATALAAALNALPDFIGANKKFIATSTPTTVVITAAKEGVDAASAKHKTAVVGATNISSAVIAEVAGVDAAAAYDKTVKYVGNDDDNNMKFTIPAQILAQISYANPTTKTQVITEAVMSDKVGNNPKTITAKTTLSFVEAIEAVSIAGLSSKTIEVGETFDFADTVKVGAAKSNVNKGFGNYTEEYFNDSAEASDYAIVDADGKVLGVAVGKNKITVALDSNGTTTSCVVTVVEKGTKPAASGTVTTVLSAWAPKLGVGETANVVVKAEKAVTYTSLDTAVVTVDAAGKLTAVKEGTAKVKVQEEGKDAVYLNVTVAAATTKPSDKPSDVPQTAVVALAPLF